MWDHLHGLAEVIATSFFGDHGLIDRSGCCVAVAMKRDIGEAFVVAEIKVGFATVVGDKHFAVLKRIHGAGVNVEIRIQLLHHDALAATSK